MPLKGSILLAILITAPAHAASVKEYKDYSGWVVLGFLLICGLIGFGQLLTALRGPRPSDTPHENTDKTEHK